MSRINWGIIGLGNIANEFAKSFEELSNANLLAVASRDEQKLKKFSKKFNISKKYNFKNYNDLINCTDIDIVYIALPHCFHYKWIVNCIEAKKNILCEKPATINLAEIRKINTLLQQQNIFFAEGFMYRYFPQTLELVKIIKDNKIGMITNMESYFGENVVFKKNIFGLKKLKINKNNRLFNKELGGGAILDLGCYPSSLSILVSSLINSLNNNKIEFLNKNVEIGPTGVDLDSYLDIKFSNNFISKIGCSFKKDLGQQTKIYGTKGKIFIENIWRHNTSSIFLNGKKVKLENLKYNNIFSYEIESISTSIINNQTQPYFPGINRFDSEKNALILENWISKNN